eukprot:914478-Prorocentrum_minimum.AAC.1
MSTARHTFVSAIYLSHHVTRTTHLRRLTDATCPPQPQTRGTKKGRTWCPAGWPRGGGSWGTPTSTPPAPPPAGDARGTTGTCAAKTTKGGSGKNKIK